MDLIQHVSSNYFAILDLEGFEAWANRMGLDVSKRDSAGSILVCIGNHDGEGLPSSVQEPPSAEELRALGLPAPTDVADDGDTQEDFDEYDVDPIADLAKLVAPGSHAVVMRIGHEGQFISGNCWVITAGVIKSVDLHRYAQEQLVAMGLSQELAQAHLAEM